MKKIFSIILCLVCATMLFITHANAQDNSFEILVDQLYRNKSEGTLVHIKNLGILIFATENGAEIIGVDKGGPLWWMLSGTVITAITRAKCSYAQTVSSVACTFPVNRELETFLELTSISLNEEIFAHFTPYYDDTVRQKQKPETRQIDIKFDFYYPPVKNYFKERLENAKRGVITK